MLNITSSSSVKSISNKENKVIKAIPTNNNKDSNFNPLKNTDVVNFSTKSTIKESNVSFYSGINNKTTLLDDFNSIEKAKSEAEQFDLLTEVVIKNNGKIDSTPENRNIVAFRNPNLPSENKTDGVYDDVTFVFWKEKDTTKKVERFKSNTDPNGSFLEERPNGDFGRIMSGKTYKYTFSYSNTIKDDCLRPISKLNIERFSPKEEKFKPVSTSLETDRTFLFHHGLATNTFSMGCQTFPRTYEQKTRTFDDSWDDFWSVIQGDNVKNRQKEINYTILEFHK